MEAKVLGKREKARPRITFIKQACTDVSMQTFGDKKSSRRWIPVEKNDQDAS